MALEQHKRAIGVFPDRPTTASALQALQDAGFASSDIAVIARDGAEQSAIAGIKVHDSVGNNAGGGARTGAFTGGVLGSVAGALVGIGTIVIPGLAPAVVLGETAAAVVSILAGGAIGAAAGGLIGALVGLGVPRHRARQYRDRVDRGEYLVMLKGTDRSLQRAEELLRTHRVSDWGVYGAQAQSASATEPQPNHYAAAPIGMAPPSDRGVDPYRANQHHLADHPEVDPRRANQYNMVDHPMDHNAPGNQSDDPHYTDRSLRQPPVDRSGVSGGFAAQPEANRYPDSYAHGDRVVDPQASTYSERYTQVERPLDADTGRYGDDYNRSDRPIATPPADMSYQTGYSNATPSAGFAGGVASGAAHSQKRAVGVFPNTYALERALEALRQARFPMHKISIVLRDVGQSNAAIGTSDASADLSRISHFTNTLVGSQQLTVPGVGTVLILGSEASALSAAIADKIAGIIPTDFVDALGKLGIPESQARIYRDRLAHGGSLVMVRGNADEVLQATSILNQTGIQDWGVYNI